MTCVKICGLTSLEDARWAWRCGADLLGFVQVQSSPRYASPEGLAEIVRGLRAEGCEARLVGVFAGDSPAEAGRVAERCSLDMVQWHGPIRSAGIGAVGRPVILASAIRNRVPWEEFAGGAWALLLDGYAPDRLGGTGRTWDWGLLRDAPAGAPRILVAGGLTPDNVADAVARSGAWGVDVSSGVEAVPGRKDPVKVERFIRSAKETGDRCRP